MLDTAHTFSIILTAAYYIILGIITLFGLFGIYLLITHGRSRLISIITSGVFIFVFLILIITSHNALSSLLGVIQ